MDCDGCRCLEIMMMIRLNQASGLNTTPISSVVAGSMTIFIKKIYLHILSKITVTVVRSQRFLITEP